MIDPNRFYDYSLYDSDGEREHSQTYINRGNHHPQKGRIDNTVSISEYKYGELKKELENLGIEKRSYETSGHTYYDKYAEIVERYNRLEKYLNNTVFQQIDTSNIHTYSVGLCCAVEVRNCRNGRVVTYVIVPEGDVNLVKGWISIKAPFAQGLLGHKVGDFVNISVPKGNLEFEILEIFVPYEYESNRNNVPKPQVKQQTRRPDPPKPPLPVPKPKKKKVKIKVPKVNFIPVPDKIKTFLKRFHGKKVMDNDIQHFLKKNPDIDSVSLEIRCDQHNQSLH